MGIWYKDTRVSLSHNTSLNLADLQEETVHYCFQNVSFDPKLLKMAEEELALYPWFGGFKHPVTGHWSGGFKPRKGEKGYERLLLQYYASVYWEATGEWPTAGW